MTKAEARAYVFGIAATLVDSDRNQGWIRDGEDGEERSPEERAKIEDAIGYVSGMLLKKSKARR